DVPFVARECVRDIGESTAGHTDFEVGMLTPQTADEQIQRPPAGDVPARRGAGQPFRGFGRSPGSPEPVAFLGRQRTSGHLLRPPSQGTPSFWEGVPCLWGSQARSNSPDLVPERKASHSPGANTRAGPVGFLESRTPTRPSARCAASTQSLPPWLRELLNQFAAV